MVLDHLINTATVLPGRRTSCFDRDGRRRTLRGQGRRARGGDDDEIALRGQGRRAGGDDDEIALRGQGRRAGGDEVESRCGPRRNDRVDLWYPHVRRRLLRGFGRAPRGRRMCVADGRRDCGSGRARYIIVEYSTNRRENNPQKDAGHGLELTTVGMTKPVVAVAVEKGWSACRF